MKVPPKKPRFFKPILPGFKNGLKIPTGFLKYLKGHEHIKRAVLKSDGKKWLVKLNGRRLEDGWKKFTEELNLQLGDLLIFRHEGDMEFEVSIFDSSHLDREYGAEETSKKFESKEKPNTSIKSLIKASSLAKAAAHKPFGRPNFEGDHIMFEVVTYGETPIWKFHVVTDAETPMRKFQGCRIKTLDVTALKLQVPASTSADANPHFISTVRSYSITISALYLPLTFAKSTGLMNGRHEMILIDEKHRSWSMWLGPIGKCFGIRRGWTKFIKVNGFRVGDTYKFELIHNGKIPIAYVHCIYSGKDA